jgi:hypothetical protein
LSSNGQDESPMVLQKKIFLAVDCIHGSVSYAAILSYSPHKPVLIFVSSRRQTRLTAMDIISHVAGDGKNMEFVLWCFLREKQKRTTETICHWQ